ncbi:alpha/beta hydrolase [Fulvivirga ligni]|uniref:alpha/beta hydrolase n=1 Tax=Fulvivirga ligni TaxID=2904246 RepID=UPI001F264619|nr:alpha/beta hydrolase [Fulvivirga ligni]UII21393.1 alpha/beta hydrolase [Fulvivirga ligni]
MKRPLLSIWLALSLIIACQKSEDLLPVFPSSTISTPSQEGSKTINASKHRTKKKFLLVHGAWHPEGSWTKIIVGLKIYGHEVYTVQLPGLGTDRTPLNQVTLASHVSAVTNKLLEIGPDVTLVGHSYGGVVISQAAENLSSYINKVVYVSAFMLQNGESLLDIAMNDANSVVTKNIMITGDSVYIPAQFYDEAFYNYGLDSENRNLQADVLFIKTLLVPQPLSTFVTPVSLSSAYYNLEKVYISCLQDHAITPGTQCFMYSRFPNVDLHIMAQSDHSPFLFKPKKLVEILNGL